MNKEIQALQKIVPNMVLVWQRLNGTVCIRIDKQYFIINLK